MTKIQVEEKYERNGWPSLARPDARPPAGWSLSLITSVNRIHHHQLAPDGRRIAFVWDRDGLSDVYVMPSGGGWPARVTTDRASVPYWWDAAPCWSPDGAWLAFGSGGQVQVAPADGGLPRTISDFARGASSPAWLPDSRRLLVSVERNGRTELLLTDREGGWPQPLYRELGAAPGDDDDPQPAPDGRLVAFVHHPHDDLNRSEVCIADLASGTARRLGGAARLKEWSPRWSPDGTSIAYLSQRSGWNEIWLVGPPDAQPRQLTHLECDAADLAWAPDGRRIACVVNRGGAYDLVLVDISSGEASFLRAGLGCYARPCWSPDGTFLTVEYEDPSTPPDLYRVGVPGGEIAQLTFSNPPALARNRMVVPQRASYPSFDGRTIHALLYRPEHPNGAAVVYPHGGPRDQYLFDWDILAQYFVAKGYTWLAPNYRGSTGYGVEFEQLNSDDWGVGDARDCLHGAKFLRDLPGIDPQRIAIYGGSYGGYMVACCLSRDPEYLFACGVYKYGDAHLFSSWAQCERGTRLYTEMQLGHPARNRQIYTAASPILQVGQIQRPVLILHGLDDDVCPPQSSEEWVEALRRAGKTFEYKTYAGEPHGFLKRANLLDVCERIERFLDWHLMP
jgi:dipeptidyl aminopeptidase/acylaminoacyl peptidase